MQECIIDCFGVVVRLIVIAVGNIVTAIILSVIQGSTQPKIQFSSILSPFKGQLSSICKAKIGNSPLLFVVRVATCLSSLWGICNSIGCDDFHTCAKGQTLEPHLNLLDLSMCCLWDSKISKTCWSVWSFIPPCC